METDDQLEHRLARRDDAALQECYTRYGPSVLAYLRRYVGPDDAEDVLQRTFLDAWRSAERYDPTRSLAAWLFTIARRRAVDSLRQRRPAVVSVEVLRDLVGADGERVADQFAWAADVRAALGQLSDGQREVLELAYFADCTQSEVARRLDLPIGTVKARMSRGHKALAVLLDGYDGRPSAATDRRTTTEGGTST